MILRKLLNAAALLATSVCFASSASAGPATWTDVIGGGVLLDYGSSYSYTHDITDDPDGFIPGGMQALSGTLQIDLYDDDQCSWLECLVEWVPESVLITIEEFDFDSGTIQLMGDFDGELEYQALLAINQDGFLDVEISSITGDFWIGDSTLIIQGVPEPGMLGMMGAGLLSLAWFRRRKQALVPA